MTISPIQRDLDRHENSKKRKINIQQTYREATQYSCPQRDTYYETVEGAKRDNADVVFDSTAQDATSKFVSNIQSRVVPPMKQFVRLGVGPAVQDPYREEAKKGLDVITNVMFTHLQNSNFDIQVAESFWDLALGTGALLLQKGTRAKPFNFISVPLSQLYLEEAADGKVGMASREYTLAYRSILETWPDANLDKELQDKVDASPDEKITLVEMTIPHKMQVRQQGPNGRFQWVPVDGFRYTVIDPGTKKRLLERKQTSSPWIIFRWSILPGEVYGRGPLLQALADIKTLNKAKELTLKNAAMAISGAWTVRDDGVINVNTIKIYPGAKIPVESNDGGTFGPTIKRLEAAGDFDVSTLVIKELQNAVRSILFADPMGPIDLPVKSATEVSLRQQELASRIGSSFGRLQYELLAPLINRMLHILEELGLVNLQNYRVDGSVIAIQHISPLAMSQDEETLTQLLRYGEFMSKTFGPQASLILIKAQKYAQHVSDLLHIPSDMVPTDEEWKQFQQMMMTMAASGAMQGSGQGGGGAA